MKKVQLVEILHKRIAGRDKSSSLSKPLLEKYISLAWEQIMYDTFKRNPHELDLYAKEYSDLAIVDGKVELPVQIVQLPNMAGIRQLRLGEYSIGIQSIGMSAIHDELEVGSVDREYSYSLYGNIIKIYGKQDYSTVSIFLIPTFDNYEANDDVYVPGGKSQVFVETIYSFLRDYFRDNQIENNNEQAI